MREIVFNITPEPDGGFLAECDSEGIFTEGDDWNDLCYMVLDATKAMYFDSIPPDRTRLILHREEVISVSTKGYAGVHPLRV